MRAVEAAGGFEPPSKGFADLSLSHLGTPPRADSDYKAQRESRPNREVSPGSPLSELASGLSRRKPPVGCGLPGKKRRECPDCGVTWTPRVQEEGEFRGLRERLPELLGPSDSQELPDRSQGVSPDLLDRFAA